MTPQSSREAEVWYETAPNGVPTLIVLGPFDTSGPVTVIAANGEGS